MDTADTTSAPPRRRPLVLAAAAAAVLALIGLADTADLLKPVLTGDGKAGGLGDVEKAINAIKGPATVTVASLSGLGVLGAAALLAVGSQTGPRIAMLSLGALFAIALGNALIA
ncbi:MAG: hypothetical protein GXY03_07490 [Solirubrobacterales bacterium]|nr:hypothetical protein [Solirubrobacterales bacterium]